MSFFVAITEQGICKKEKVRKSLVHGKHEATHFHDETAKDNPAANVTFLLGSYVKVITKANNGEGFFTNCHFNVRMREAQ